MTTLEVGSPATDVSPALVQLTRDTSINDDRFDTARLAAATGALASLMQPCVIAVECVDFPDYLHTPRWLVAVVDHTSGAASNWASWVRQGRKAEPDGPFEPRQLTTAELAMLALDLPVDALLTHAVHGCLYAMTLDLVVIESGQSLASLQVLPLLGGYKPTEREAVFRFAESHRRRLWTARRVPTCGFRS